MTDPHRWADGRSPKGGDALVRALEPAPPLDEATRAQVRNQLLHATAVVVPPRMAWRAPVIGATAVVLAGILLWRFQPTDEPAEVELRPEVAAAVDRVVEAPAAAVTPSRVAITSEPSGATIYVDGEMRGTAPLQLELLPGTYTIEAELEGYASARVTHSANRGERARVVLALAAEPRVAHASMERHRERRRVREGPAARNPPRETNSFLVINTNPWSRVYVDGRFIGNTPIVRHRVRAGRHRVRFETEDGIEEEITISVDEGEVIRLIRQLRRASSMQIVPDNPF